MWQNFLYGVPPVPPCFTLEVFFNSLLQCRISPLKAKRYVLATAVLLVLRRGKVVEPEPR